MAPLFKIVPKRALGIHVGPAQVKVVEIERGREPIITALLWEETPPEAYVGNRLENPSALASTLIRMLQGARIKTKLVLGAVDHIDVLSRNITLPNMPIRELRKAILFETEASLPSGTGDNVLEYAILRNFTDEEDKSEKVDVLIMSAQKQPLGSLVEAFLEAGLHPTALDLTPIAAHRAEKKSPNLANRGGDYIQITINDKCTDLTIIHNNDVRVIRSIPIGSVGLVDALGERHLFDAGLGVARKDTRKTDPISGEEVVLEKTSEEELEFGAFGEDPFSSEIGSGEQMLPHESIEEMDELARLNPLMTELVDETLNTIRYGQSIGRERIEIGFGIINGYFPYGENFVRSVSEKLGIPVIQGDPLYGLQVAGSGIKEDLLQYFAPDFSCPIGLAMRGVHQFG